MKPLLAFLVAEFICFSYQTFATPCTDFIASKASPEGMKKLFTDASHIPIKKDEFETSDQYKIRQHSEVDALNVERKPGSPTKVFFTGKEFQSWNWSFNADKGELTAPMRSAYGSSDPAPTEKFSSIGLVAVELSREGSYGDSYTATNGFGAKAIISKITANQYGLAITKSSFPLRMPTIVLKQTPEQAKSVKSGKTGVLYGYSIAEPYWREFYTHLPPTIENPTDIDYISHYVVADLVCSLIYDTTTNQILYSMK
jgi:hypothetical protein